MVVLQVRTHAAAKGLRGERLPDRADVVALARDREEAHAPDGGGIDGAATDLERSFRQRLVLENGLHRLQVELRGEVHGREVLLVELARRIGLGVLALDAAVEQIAERLEMALEVHADEGDRKSTRLNSSHTVISDAVFCLITNTHCKP